MELLLQYKKCLAHLCTIAIIALLLLETILEIKECK